MRSLSPASIALFLDVDGTLLRLAPTPDTVAVEDATIELLARSHRATGGALALVSGRSISDVDRLFAPLVLPIAGQHGLERRDATGAVWRHGGPPPQLASIRARLDTFAQAHPGVLIEDKTLTVAAHYRLAPAAEPALAALVAAIAAESPGTLAIQRGKMVFELRAAGRDKGTAIAEYMTEAPFRGRTPVFIGDDLTDEHGFAVVNELGGVTVKVGDGTTAARHRIASVEAVHEWLATLTANEERRQ